MARKNKTRDNINRRQKRKLQELTDKLQQGFSKITQEFGSDVLNSQASGEELDEVDIEIYNKRWKNYAKKLLHKYLTQEENNKRRPQVLKRFEEFVDKFLERKELAEYLLVEKTGKEVMRANLKKIGVITQAKTDKGVQKRVDELTDDQKASLVAVFNGDL